MENVGHSDEIAAQVRPLLHRVKTGGPQFWGCGVGRPGDGYYELVAFEVDRDLLRLHIGHGAETKSRQGWIFNRSQPIASRFYS